MPRKWVQNLTITYSAKGSKPLKKVEITEDDHQKMARDVAMAYDLVGIGEESSYGIPKSRNYLAVNFAFIVSTKTHVPNGDHGRVLIKFPFYIEKHSLVTRRELLLGNSTTGEYGWHTEQALYAYLKSDIGKNNLYGQFKNKVIKKSKEGKIELSEDGEIKHLKVYGLVIKMHSHWQMCFYARSAGEKACVEASIQEIFSNSATNLRATIANIFLDKEHPVSGYDLSGDPRPGKIPFKMTVLCSYSKLYHSADKDEEIGTSINRFLNTKKPDAANCMVYLKKQGYALKEGDKEPKEYKLLSKKRTILRSSSKLGIDWRFDKELAAENWAKVRSLLRFAPFELAKVIKDVPQKHHSSVCYSLLHAAIVTGQFNITITCFYAGAKLVPKYYHFRNDKGKAIAVYPDDEGYTYLWGVMEEGTIPAKETAVKIMTAAQLTKDEMLSSHGDEIIEYAAPFATKIQKIRRGYIDRIKTKQEKESQDKSWVEFVGKQPIFLQDTLKKAKVYERRSYQLIIKDDTSKGAEYLEL